MTKEEWIADYINNKLNLNIYQNTRTLPLVDARSLYCYILHKEFKYTLYKVRDSLRAKGKKYDHATVIHAVNIFDEVRRRRKDIECLKEEIMNGISVKHNLIRKIEKINNDRFLTKVNNYIKKEYERSN